MKKLILLCILLVVTFLLTSTNAPGFGESGGACEKDCSKCHQLTKEEAGAIFNALAPNANIEVVDVEMSPVRGLWEIYIKVMGRKDVLYMDFSRGNIIQGSIINIKNRINITSERRRELTRIDISKIPLDSALIMGNKDAKYKVIVFSDPECPYCMKLHQEMKKVLEKTGDIVFFIKLYPLQQLHPSAYEKSKAIVCEKSLKFLEDVMYGETYSKPECEASKGIWDSNTKICTLPKPLPKPDCEGKEVDDNIKLAMEMGITGTPAIILPDGNVIPSYIDADTLIKLIIKQP